MQYRKLGKLDWNVSVIGLGCWGLGGQWGPIGDNEAEAIVHEAYELGINLFDTADAYGEPQGTSELRVGRALKGFRDKVYLATKVGNWGRRLGHPLPFTHPNHLIACCHASLYRLQTDYIDLYQVHTRPQDYDIWLEALNTLRDEGKIRAYAISTDNLEVLQAFNRDGQCASNQLDYSIINRSPEAELLPYCGEHGIGTLIRGPLAKGVLTGKFKTDTVFEDSVRARWNEGEAHDKFLSQVAQVERLRPLTREGQTMGQAALRFVLHHPAVTCAIPGAKDLGQIRQNAAAADAPLSDEDLALIASVC